MLISGLEFGEKRSGWQGMAWLPWLHLVPVGKDMEQCSGLGMQTNRQHDGSEVNRSFIWSHADCLR